MPSPPSLAMVEAALSGGPPLLPPGRPPGEVPPGVACVVATSGSTGLPKRVALGADALLASAQASERRLGGPGQWLACLPTDHIAGLQVLIRSVVAGTAPVAIPPGRGFTPEAFSAAAARLSGPRRYGSLVPTQLYRLLAGPPGPLAALARLDAVLVGGAALGAGLAERAKRAGVRVVTTYGASETAGGCVYDGRPLDGVKAAIGPDGRIALSGMTLALGYLTEGGSLAPEPEAPGAGEGFSGRGPDRVFVTPDLGAWRSGRLAVLGRADDVIVTGGMKVSPGAVEEVVRSLSGVRHVAVVGCPDEQWGQRVVAVVVTEGTAPGLDAVREAVAARLGRHAAPARVVPVTEIPTIGIGKPDRAALLRLAGT